MHDNENEMWEALIEQQEEQERIFWDEVNAPMTY